MPLTDEEKKQRKHDYYIAHKDKWEAAKKKNPEERKIRFRAYSLKYYYSHKEVCALRNKKWDTEHKERKLELGRLWDAAHPEKVKADHQRRYNDPILHARALETRAKYYKEHREEQCAYSAKWKKEHPELNRFNAQKYHARKLSAPGANYTTVEMMQARSDMWDGKCYLCGMPATAIDHVKPLSAGGGHWPCNLRPICQPCNSSKRGKWPYDFAKHKAQVRDQIQHWCSVLDIVYEPDMVD